MWGHVIFNNGGCGFVDIGFNVSANDHSLHWESCSSGGDVSDIFEVRVLSGETLPSLPHIRFAQWGGKAGCFVKLIRLSTLSQF